MPYFRSTIEALQAYVPGEQPLPGTDVVKLNTNENPYPPSPHAIEVLQSVDPDGLRRYPDAFAEEFRQSSAEVLGLDPTWILVGNGSDELLTMLMRAVAARDRSVAYPVPTYSLYGTLATIQGAPAVEVPFDDAYTLPVESLVRADSALTLVANPNSPSGTTMPIDRLSELASRLNGVLAIDEAYVEFADTNALELVRRFDRVIVLRTLSKSHSLAGLRLGFAAANPTLLAGLAKVKDSYNIDAIAARVGAAAMRDTTYTQTNIARVRASRAYLTEQLDTLGFRVWPSQANFVLAQPPNKGAQHLYAALKARHILVRYFTTQGLADKLRITVGTDEQIARLIDALQQLLRT